jgi:hypothetical protein
MNERQKGVLLIGFLLILGTGLYPPWVQSWDFVASGEDLRFRIEPGSEAYSWICLPPGVPAWVEGSFPSPNDPNIKADAIKDVSENGIRTLLRSVRSPGRWRAHIDATRLLVEWAMIVAGVVVGLLFFGQGRTNIGLPAPK